MTLDLGVPSRERTPQEEVWQNDIAFAEIPLAKKPSFAPSEGSLLLNGK